MEFKDYYEVMGVAREATQDEIKRAYRKLARKYHPDVSKEADAEKKFKQVGEAYEVLKNPEKRAAYDQLGSNYQAGQDFRPPPDWDAGFEFSGGPAGASSAEYSDFFESIFGAQSHAGGRAGAGRRSARMRGEDHHAKVLIDIIDSYKGASRAITLRLPEVTPEGHVISRERTLNVRIPKGVYEGQQIRLGGQGGAGLGEAPSGDLYLTIEFSPHKIYRAEGTDVYINLPITPWEAALGASVTVPTPDARVDLKVPAHSTQGKKLRLKGRGLPAKQPGDLYVVLQIALPPAETDEAKALYKEMAEKMKFNPRADMGA